MIQITEKDQQEAIKCAQYLASSAMPLRKFEPDEIDIKNHLNVLLLILNGVSLEKTANRPLQQRIEEDKYGGIPSVDW